MLFISLFMSAFMLLLANGVIRTRHPILQFVLFGGGLCFGTLLLSCVLPVLFLQALLLLPLVLVWAWRDWRAISFTCMSCAVTVVAYAVVGWFAYQDVARLRDRYPYVSMETRLPTPVRPALVLTAASEKHLDDLETRIEEDQGKGMTSLRLRRLETLHENTVEIFVNRPGFGVTRMITPEAVLRYGERPEEVIPQPAAASALTWSSGELDVASPSRTPPDLEGTWDLHRDSFVDFVNPKGFGFFKDRRHVAGFQPHRLSRAPAPDNAWVLQTLDLVGLARHEQGIAYVSANLPRMDELRDAPTRSLDDFEVVGLKALREGEDIFVVDRAEGRRMLGALRSTRQCVSCHEGGRGQLLGAFSYTLTRPKAGEAGKAP